MIALLLLLGAVLVASLALNVACIVRIDEHRQTDRLRLSAMRGMRQRIANQEALLDGTERAVEVAREVMRGIDPPIFLEVSEELAEREATVLQFRQSLDEWPGDAS